MRRPTPREATPRLRAARWVAALVAAAALSSSGCDGARVSDAGADADADAGPSRDGSRDEDAGAGDSGPDGFDPDGEAPVPAGPRCATEREACATDGEHLGDTCCARGDPLVRLSGGTAAEAVDIASDGRLAVLCGGFGARISDVSAPAEPRFLGGAGRRCQHAAFGPTVEGEQILYVTHHGDSWVELPSLSTYGVDPSGAIREIDVVGAPGTSFEGADYRDGFLYVAVHEQGVQVHSVDDRGVPSLEGVVAGLGNAWKVEVSGDVAYVVDNDGMVHVLSLADPAAPLVVGSVATTAPPRDATLSESRLFVALGGSGVDVFDVSDPTEPEHEAHFETLGSAQSVAASEGVLAVAAWSHVALYDATTLVLLATEKTRSRTEFEQDLGVAMSGSTVLVAEWEGLHLFEHRRGLVSPDLWLDEELLTFDAERVDARAVIVRNVGHLPLEVSEVELENAEPFELDRTSLAIDPGEAGAFELTFTPPGTPVSTTLEIASNDVDEPRARLLVVSSDGSGIDVGDPLTEAFGFLDPTGAGQLANLEGHVVVLSYFALF